MRTIQRLNFYVLQEPDAFVCCVRLNYGEIKKNKRWLKGLLKATDKSEYKLQQQSVADAPMWFF